MERTVPYCQILSPPSWCPTRKLGITSRLLPAWSKRISTQTTVECDHKGWQGPHVVFGRRWNRLVATWGYASSSDCQWRGLQDPAEYNGPGTPNKIHFSSVLEHTPQRLICLLEVVWYPKGLQQTTKNDTLVFSDGIPYCNSSAMGKLTT